MNSCIGGIALNTRGDCLRQSFIGANPASITLNYYIHSIGIGVN